MSVLTLLLAATALTTSAPGPGQGPDTGSPFVDAPLPIEALKAPPDSTFQILVASLGVFLLVPITAAAFLALARLRNLEESLTKEIRLLREEIEVHDDDELVEGGTSVEDATVRLEAAVTEVRASIERVAASSLGAGTGSAVDDVDRIVGALDAAREAQATATRDTIERLEALATAVREAAVGQTPQNPAAGAPAAKGAAPTSPVAAALDRVHTRLAALGYSAVEVVTPRDEITDEVLASGELVVEARRSGAVHKGKVVLEDGVPVDVQIQPGHGMFP